MILTRIRILAFLIFASYHVAVSAQTPAMSGRSPSPNLLPIWAFGGFIRPEEINPVITPDTSAAFIDPMTHHYLRWEANDTFNPAAIVKGGKVVVLYRAEDKTGLAIGTRTSRIGYAESKDGTHFKRKEKPVMFPAVDSQKGFEWPGGCEDPRVAVTESGVYVMLYTEWNRDIPRLGVATSRDLLRWKKYGPIFQNAYRGKFANMATKSASILTRLVASKQVIAKIRGKYWMYWGEAHVYTATSIDLIHWVPLVDENGALKALMSPRNGYFDSDLTECGPPAIVTAKGIILFYNGKNHLGNGGDKRFAGNSYSAGQALFSRNDPARCLDRLAVPYLRPMESFEKSGQYVSGTVFTEGLVYFKKKWFLYYGCADSRVGVAIFDPLHPGLADPVPLDTLRTIQ